MEIMILEEGLTKSYTSYEQLGFAQFGMQIADSPEDYIFLLTPKEWDEWLELYATLGKALLSVKTLDAKSKVLDDFAEKNASNPLSLICIVSTHPKFGNYKLGNLTPYALGDCYAIFFGKEEQIMKRSDEVTRRVLQFREEQAKKPPLS
ncbi:hypothetical protein ACFLW7_02125 [Chloroflexota bacterium]